MFDFLDRPVSQKTANKIGTILIAISVVFYLVWAVPTREKTITIAEKDIVGRNASTQSGVVIATDEQTYSVHWSLAKLNFNHRKTYAEIKEGATQTVLVNGHDVPWLFSQENILKVLETE